MHCTFINQAGFWYYLNLIIANNKCSFLSYLENIAFLSTRIKASFKLMLTLSNGWKKYVTEVVRIINVYKTKKMRNVKSNAKTEDLMLLGVFTCMALRRPCTVLRGKKESWSKVSITFEEDSMRIIGADVTMLESSSERNKNKLILEMFKLNLTSQWSTTRQTNKMSNWWSSLSNQSIQNLLQNLYSDWLVHLCKISKQKHSLPFTSKQDEQVQ